MANIIVANVILGISSLISVITMQFKDKRQILIGMILVNTVALFSFLILKKYSAIIVCLIATVQTYIKYKFDQKNKNVPIIIQVILIVISILSGILTFKTWFDILPVASLVFYILSVLQSKEKNFRLYTLGKVSGWIIYDFYAKAYTGFIFYICILISTIIAIIRYDIKRESVIKVCEDS
ncbi:MAG: YgjV family protein [Clostridia bacterium]|nr:YgjV family protein [Clostridia bacterium]